MNWDQLDFVAAAILILTALGGLLIVVTRRGWVAKIAGLALVIVVGLVWAELAVGFFS